MNASANKLSLDADDQAQAGYRDAGGTRAGDQTLRQRAARSGSLRPVDADQSDWYNVGIATLMVLLLLVLVQGIWFSSY